MKNLTEIVKYLDANFSFRRNEFTQNFEYQNNESKEWNILDDVCLNSIWYELQILEITTSPKTLEQIIKRDSVKSFNPISEYFESLRPEKFDWIEKLCECLEIEDFEFLVDGKITTMKKEFPKLMKKYLISSFLCANGIIENQVCLTLSGNQGIGKTTFLNKLCPVERMLFVGHIQPDITNSTTADLLAEKWFINIDDQLDQIMVKDFNSLKGVISTPFVSNRKVFRRDSKVRKRRASFTASVNKKNFLIDTENRRYFCIHVEKINTELLNILEPGLIWGHVKYLVNQKEKPFIMDDSKIINEISKRFLKSTLEEELLMKYFQPLNEKDHPFELNDENNYKLASEILIRIKSSSYGININERILSAALDRNGFKKYSKRLFRFQNNPRYVYFCKEL